MNKKLTKKSFNEINFTMEVKKFYDVRSPEYDAPFANEILVGLN